MATSVAVDAAAVAVSSMAFSNLGLEHVPVTVWLSDRASSCAEFIIHSDNWFQRAASTFIDVVVCTLIDRWEKLNGAMAIAHYFNEARTAVFLSVASLLEGRPVTAKEEILMQRKYKPKSHSCTRLLYHWRKVLLTFAEEWEGLLEAEEPALEAVAVVESLFAHTTFGENEQAILLPMLVKIVREARHDLVRNLALTMTIYVDAGRSSSGVRINTKYRYDFPETLPKKYQVCEAVRRDADDEARDVEKEVVSALANAEASVGDIHGRMNSAHVDGSDTCTMDHHLSLDYVPVSPGGKRRRSGSGDSGDFTVSNEPPRWRSKADSSGVNSVVVQNDDSGDSDDSNNSDSQDSDRSSVKEEGRLEYQWHLEDLLDHSGVVSVETMKSVVNEEVAKRVMRYKRQLEKEKKKRRQVEREWKEIREELKKSQEQVKILAEKLAAFSV